MINDMQQ